MNRTPVTLAARYVFPVEGPPIADGFVEIRDGHILSIGPANGRQADMDLGNVAITPGFTNAHTHLELSPLTDEEPAEGQVIDEIDWLGRVVAHRRATRPDALRQAASRNLLASLEAGTTLMADTATPGTSWDAIATAPIRAVVFAEMIGLKRSRSLQTNQSAWEWIASIGPTDQVKAAARPGLSPHAPYSTAGWLYHRAAGSRMPLSTHLAEMPEELELLQHGEGRLRDFLLEIDAWDDGWEPIGPRPADFVRRGELREADWLIAHGTYLDPGDYWQFRQEAAPDGQRVAVAYCPRTHARFGHAPHPFRTMLERGIVVCLGTDSLASNPSLGILDEMRFLHRADPALSGALLLTMATLFGAWALRADGVTGSLKPGKSADLAIIALPDRDDVADPHHLLLDSDLPVVASTFEGLFTTGPWAND